MVPRAEKAVLAAARLVVRAGLVGDPDPRIGIRLFSLAERTRPAKPADGHRIVRRQRRVQPVVEPIVFQDATTGLGAVGGAVAVALDPGPDRPAGPAVLYRKPAAGAVPGLGFLRCLSQPDDRAAQR